jgi:hemoglobin/transferrin/lactoferrin receptor protein
MRSSHLFLCAILAATNSLAEETTIEIPTDISGGFGLAPSEAKPDEVLELSVTATRSPLDAKKIPQSIKTIPQTEMISKRQSATVPDALRQESGILLQKTSQGQGSPFIRGFTGFRNLLLIDGVRFNNSVMRDGPNQYWNTVDLFSIDRLDVLKGPSSVLYGSDAIGGTINVLTPDLLAKADANPVNGRLLYRYGSADSSRIQRVQVTGRSGKDFGISLGGTKKVFGDVRAGAKTGLQPKTGYEELAFDVKAQGNIGVKDKVTLVWRKGEQDDIWRTHSTIFGKSFRGAKVGSDLKRSLDQETELAYAKHKHTFESGFLTNVETILSYQRQAETETRISSNSTKTEQGFIVHTPGASVQMQSFGETGLWTFGVESYRDLVDSEKLNYNKDGSFKSKSIQGPIGDNSTYESLGIYVQNQYSVTNSLALTTGLRQNSNKAKVDRYEDPATKAATTLSRDYSATVGTIKGAYDVAPAIGGKLFAGVSQGFRAPNLSDLTRFDIARSSELELPAPDLKPERYLSYELGSKIGDVNNWMAEIWLFKTNIENMIIRTPTGDINSDGSRTVTKKNAGKGYVQGVELDSFYRFSPNIVGGGNYTFQWGELEAYPTSTIEKKKEPMSRVMPATLNLNARYEWSDRTNWVEGLYTLVRRQDRLSASDRLDDQRIPPGGSAGYKTYSLRAGTIMAKDTRITLALDNILNEDYRVLGSGVNEPGRSFIATLDIWL